MPESKEFGYGIIGCGWVAEDHARSVHALAEQGVRLVGVADVDPDRARAFANDFDVEFHTSDYRELLSRDDIDALSLCVPDFLHAQVSIAAAIAGKHVLCEKPVALNLKEADEMLEVFDCTGVTAGVVFNHRYAADNILARRIIREGALGDVALSNLVHVSALAGNPAGNSPWRGRKGLSAGGVLATQAIHFLDLLFWFLGPAESVSATLGIKGTRSGEHEDMAVLNLRLASGALASVASTNVGVIENDFDGTRIDVFGSTGHVSLSGDKMVQMVADSDSARQVVDLPEPALIDGGIFGGGHYYAVSDFIWAARERRRAPVPMEDGRHLMAVLDAIEESTQTGRQVTILHAGADAYQQSALHEESLLVGRTKSMNILNSI